MKTMKNLFVNGISKGIFAEEELKKYIKENNIINSWQTRVKIVDVEEYQQELQDRAMSCKILNDRVRQNSTPDFSDKSDVWEDYQKNDAVALLNSPIMTEYGEYKYSPLSLKEAKSIVHKNGFFSHIGHDSTCSIISSLLNIVGVNMNRAKYSQKIGGKAIVFKLKGRPEEGKILSIDEIESIGYEFCLIERTK